MSYFYRCLLLILLLLPAARLRAQHMDMPAAGAVATILCSGTVADPGGPSGNYGDNVTSQLAIYPSLNPTGRRVQLTFTAFQLEQNYDFLTIYDGPNTSAPQLARLTGSQGLNQTFTATSFSGVLTLLLTTDPSYSYSGFVASVNCITAPGDNVGIGTTAPLEKLHVAGAVYAQEGFRFPDGSLQTTAATTTAPDNLGNHTASQNLGLNGNWLSNNGGSQGLRIDNNGNVGIGTATPAARLDVNGDARVGGNLSLTGNATVGGALAVGLEQVTQDFTVPGFNLLAPSVSCPAGKRLLGGGGGMLNLTASNYNTFSLLYNGPDENAPVSTWKIKVANTSNSNHTVRIYCICARLAP
ncbi:hypothetical protein EJV47_25685 [Hymenobacter gummosus]|uniref:CUB domain-containing protein n=1 Tax=Hymenobacter gummosus TaxID=1776032 RepID=A0A431TUS8_9BACT|nr:CUB domain-containing protein [Hymenobacter gummosus]RTQ45273.1 hypothetical protein EJV47_25685 [Hymenobacter gummosus]